MVEIEEAKSNLTSAFMGDSKRVEATIETEDKDIFDEVFEADEDEIAAKKKMAEKASELKKIKAKAMEKNNEVKDDESDSKENKSDDEGEEDDDDEEIEEDKEDSVEPAIFIEKDSENKSEEVNDSSAVDDEFETKDDAFDAVDAGGKKAKKGSSNFDDIIKEKLDKALNKANIVSSFSENPKTSRGMGGKLDLKVTNDFADEEKEVATKAHPIERKIIKSVIKNKALMAAENDLKINKGVKISDDSKTNRDYEDHDEMSDAMLREDGTKEEGILREESDVDDESDVPKQKLPKAILPVDDLDDDGSGKDDAIKPELEFLMSNKGHAYIGRKKSVLSKYGEEAGLFVGRVNEKDKDGTDVYLDGLNPHVVFVCGARGSGKSYVLGVIAEELALKNKNVGIVVVDPIGVFWSMKHPNKEEKELEILAKWGMLPRGLDNIKVFIPVGMKTSVPKSTYDAVFSIQPALLTAEDWCLTFGIDRFSPTGLLMEKGIAKAKSGYTTEEGKEIRGKQNTFSLEDLIKTFSDDSELNDREKGYKADSIRALVSRFDAAKNWGIFDEKGTSLGLLSRAGQMTILDTSFLEDNVSALVIGIISRRILAARKLGTRREAAEKFDDGVGMEELAELNIPPTWLFIDEAHTLIPGGNQKTPASNAIVEYVKQGRRPGCSLVFATQQPSAIDTKVLSQLDVIMAHKLVFDDDIKAIYKRTPTIVPGAYKRGSFIKTMPVGIALTGDRSETTSRAFIMSIRPRMSQHEGRDAETTDVKQELETEQVQILATNIVLRQLEKDPSISFDSINETLDTLNNTYKKKVGIEEILEALKKKGIDVGENSVYAKGVLEEMQNEKDEALAEKESEEALEKEIANDEASQEELSPAQKRKLPKDVEEFGEKIQEFEERIELTALQSAIDEQRARKILLGFATKRFIFADEILDRVMLKHAPIYKVRYKYFNHKDAFHVGEAFIDSLTGEFIHDDRGKIRESKGLPILLELSEAETTVLKLVAEKRRTAKDSAELMRMEEGNARRILEGLAKKGFIAAIDDGKGKIHYAPSNKLEMDLPPHPLHEMMESMGKRPITELNSASVVPAKLSEKEIPELLKKLWGNIAVKEVTQIFMPIWEGVLKKKTGEERIVMIDAINGKLVNSIE
ncbi:MAG: DUF87 domain-containing protein [archaeon]